MKKNIFYLRSVLLMVMMVVFISGCSSQSSDEGKEKQYSVSSSEVAEINIAVKDRAIEILPSSDGEIHITYLENDKEFYQIDLGEDKVLTMQSASNKELSDYIGLSGGNMNSIKLEVPNPLPSNLVISSTKNDIKLPEMVIEGNLDVQINEGAIALENLSPLGDITLNAKNGDISGTLIGSYEEYRIQSDAHKGDSNLPKSKTEGTKALNVNTNNGDIEIEFLSNE